MNWQIENHPEGGLQIRHLVAPRFTARWTTGDFPLDQVRAGEMFWTDEGSGEEDAIHLYAFAWDDPPPADRGFKKLMIAAAAAIEQYVIR